MSTNGPVEPTTSPDHTGHKQGTASNTLKRRVFNSANVCTAIAILIMAATWLTLVLMQPDDPWESLADGKGSIIALAGFGVSALIALIGIVPKLPSRSLALLPAALVINIVVGQVIGTMPLPAPLYLDSIGTVLIAALAGPQAGMATGVLSALVWGTFNPTVVPFAADYAMIGLLAGLVPWTKRWVPPIAGVFVGLLSALMAAPVASFIFGGTAGTGTGLLVTAYRGLGFSPMTAVYLQSLTSDPIDKVIVFTLVAAIIAALPLRTIRSFSTKKS